jgi:hypothetical protein
LIAIRSLGRLRNDKQDDNKHLQHQQRCSDFILKILEAADHALTYKDFGNDYKYGTLRNEMKKHIDAEKVLKLPIECPARFILKEWASRPEYNCMFRNDKRGTAAKLDVLSYLKTIGWEKGLSVHNLKLSFIVYNFRWIGKEWAYHKGSRSYSRHFDLSYPVCVECYDTGVVLVSIGCSSRPFPLDIEGVSSLLSLLGEVKNALHAPCIPEPLSWTITQWHLNRDSEQIGGPDFYITFRDFFNEAAQVYYKHETEKIRAEANQSPQCSVQQVFEEILNRDNSPKGDS